MVETKHPHEARACPICGNAPEVLYTEPRETYSVGTMTIRCCVRAGGGSPEDAFRHWQEVVSEAE